MLCCNIVDREIAQANINGIIFTCFDYDAFCHAFLCVDVLWNEKEDGKYVTILESLDIRHDLFSNILQLLRAKWQISMLQVQFIKDHYRGLSVNL